MPEIYYAGGTADKAISSRDIVEDINRIKAIGHFFPDKKALLNHLQKELKAGDVVVSMGARDPGLGNFAREILAVL
jgi:UDP-N-acetylmuramate--alanine ligase